MNVLVAVLGLAIAVANLGFWFWVVTRGSVRFEDWVSQRYGVVIGKGSRGHWSVGPDGGPWWRRFGIEMLQLAFFMGAFVVWGVLLGVSMLALAFVTP